MLTPNIFCLNVFACQWYVMSWLYVDLATTIQIGSMKPRGFTKGFLTSEVKMMMEFSYSPASSSACQYVISLLCADPTITIQINRRNLVDLQSIPW